MSIEDKLKELLENNSEISPSMLYNYSHTDDEIERLSQLSDNIKAHDLDAPARDWYVVVQHHAEGFNKMASNNKSLKHMSDLECTQAMLITTMGLLFSSIYKLEQRIKKLEDKK